MSTIRWKPPRVEWSSNSTQCDDVGFGHSIRKTGLRWQSFVKRSSRSDRSSPCVASNATKTCCWPPFLSPNHGRTYPVNVRRANGGPPPARGVVSVALDERRGSFVYDASERQDPYHRVLGHHDHRRFRVGGRVGVELAD